MHVKRAAAADLPDVLALLNGAAERLHQRGIDQWPDSPHFTADRIRPLVHAGDVYLAVAVLGTPVATITVQAGGDPDFWTPRELAEPASYLSKMARAASAPGVGASLLRWAVSAAHERGDRWVRLDAWRSNPGLHAYYADRGWAYVRTEEVAGRNSGTLFQRLALPGKHPFTSAPALPQRDKKPRFLVAGTEVFTRDWLRGVVTEVLDPGVGTEIVPADWEYGTGRPPVFYRVKLGDGREVILSEADVTEAASVAAEAHA